MLSQYTTMTFKLQNFHHFIVGFGISVAVATAIIVGVPPYAFASTDFSYGGDTSIENAGYPGFESYPVVYSGADVHITAAQTYFSTGVDDTAGQASFGILLGTVATGTPICSFPIVSPTNTTNPVPLYLNETSGTCDLHTGDYLTLKWSPSNIGGNSVYSRTGGSANPFVELSSNGTFDLPIADLSTNTHIISLTPLDNSTTTNPVHFEMRAYISPDDVGTVLGVNFTLHNIDQNVFLASGLSPSDIYFLRDFHATTSGVFDFSTTTTVGEGNYRINARLDRSFLGGGGQGLVNGLSSISQNVSHQFIVGQATFIGNLSQNSFSAVNGILASSSATSTAVTIASCSPITNDYSTLFLNTHFSPLGCLTFLFTPDPKLIDDTFTSFHDLALTHFPLGYLYDFILILSTTSEKAIPVIDATIPNGIPGAGANINLSLSHVLDPVLNATTSGFSGSGASTTETLYQYTVGYWTIFVYICAGVYILGRILGSHLFHVGMFGAQGSLSDSGDDAYALKEYLYKHRGDRNYKDRYK